MSFRILVEILHRFMQVRIKALRHPKKQLTRLSRRAPLDNKVIFFSSLEVDGRFVVECGILMELEM